MRSGLKSSTSRLFLSRLFRRGSKKVSKLSVTSLCEGNPPVTDGFPPQKASNAGNVSIWWRHNGTRLPRCWWLHTQMIFLKPYSLSYCISVCSEWPPVITSIKKSTCLFVNWCSGSQFEDMPRLFNVNVIGMTLHLTSQYYLFDTDLDHRAGSFQFCCVENKNHIWRLIDVLCAICLGYVGLIVV